MSPLPSEPAIRFCLRIEGQDANVSFIALEEDRVLAFRRDPKISPWSPVAT
jgi:hypothetical protein